MDWSSFAWFALPAAGLWLAAGAVVYRRDRAEKGAVGVKSAARADAIYIGTSKNGAGGASVGKKGAGNMGSMAAHAKDGTGCGNANAHTNLHASGTAKGGKSVGGSAKGGANGNVNANSHLNGATRAATALMLSGIALFAIFIVGFWITLARPPMRTMGETRLWYSLFLAAVGFAAWRRWRYPWLLSYSAVVATVFVLINILKPEIHSRNLMPALQSAWFVPHVTSYILSYAMLGAATIGALIQLNRRAGIDRGIGTMIDNMVWAGFGLLVLGMLMGAVWAKSAWGHYWEWDPKETWALATALAYLGYIHLRQASGRYERTALWLLPVAFAMLLITWIGVNYLPAAQSSVHVY